MCRSLLSHVPYIIPIAALIWLEPQQQIESQIIPVGDPTVVHQTGSAFEITGGTLSGDTTNLFHDFADFNLTQAQSATFFADPNIQNILSKISGGNPSIIDGLLSVKNSSANLFLLNPSGFVFGANAQLDISGSFVASTATKVGFGEAFLQSFGTNDYTTLNGNPTSFIFDSATGSILNQGNLAVPNGESLWLIGHSILNLGDLSAPNGNISLTAMPEQRQIKISQPGGLLSLVLDATPLGETALPDDVQLLQTTNLAQYLTGSEENVTVSNSGEILLQQGEQTLPFFTGDVGIAGSIVADSVQLMAAGRVTPTDFSRIRAGEGDRHGLTVVRFRENLEDSLGYTFIDQRADHPDQLLFGGESGTIATVVLKQEAGLEAVTNALLEFAATGTTLDAINIVAEGNQGYFWLGRDLVDGATLEAYQAQLQQWRSVLGHDADLLLYSCFTALGMDGEALLTQLADLTGADVAASLDVTGSAEFEGDWKLEYSTGDIEANNPFTVETLARWEGKLATILVQNLNDSGVDSLRNAFAIANPGDMIIPTLSGTVLLTTGEITWGTDNLTLDGSSQNFTVDGSNLSGIFNISANNATIDSVTIRNGRTPFSGGAGISNSGTLTLRNSTVSGNTSLDRGAGISNTGSATIINSDLSGNNATGMYGYGGGIYNAGTIQLTNSAVTNNSANYSGGGIYNSGNITITDSTISGNTALSASDGGGIYNSFGATANITRSTITGNTADFNGGGIYNSGAIAITASTISGNTATTNLGGGIHNETGGTLTLQDSLVTGNNADFSGGGIYNSGNLTVETTVVSDNNAGQVGGGISNINGTVTISSSTISGNSSGNTAGGLDNSGGTLTVRNSTVSGNTANIAGGIYNGSGSNLNLENSTVSGNSAPTIGGVAQQGFGNLINTIVANNSGGDWTGGLPSVYGANIIADGSISGAGIINVDPQLSPLGDFGGTRVGNPNTGTVPLDVYFLRVGSPALNAGDDAFVGTSFDQRGGDRQVGVVDLGAVEFQGTNLSINQGNNQSAAVNTAFPTPLSVSAAEVNFGNPIQGLTLNFNAPTSGASTASSAFSTTTDIAGNGSFAAIANGTAGSFNVVVTAAATPNLIFTLTNTVNNSTTSPTSVPPSSFDPIINPLRDLSVEPPLGQPGLPPNETPIAVNGVEALNPPGSRPNPQRENRSENVDPRDLPPESGTPQNNQAIATNPAIFTAAELEQAAEYSNHLNRQFPTPLTAVQSQSLLATLNAQTNTKTAYISLRFRPISNNLAAKKGILTSQSRQSKINKKIDPLKPWFSQVPNQINGQDPLEIIITTADDGIVVKTLSLTRQELINLERELLRVVTFPNPLFQGRLDRVLTSLHQQILSPIETTLQAAEIDTILLSVGQGLRSIPWAALYDGEQYLIEKYGLSITPNLSLTDATYRPLYNREVLAMGASDFSELNDLPAVPTELKLISQQFDNVEYFLNEAFTAENLLAARDRLNPGIIHLATHASFRGGNLDQSYIQLWGEDRLAISEIEQLQWFRNPPIELLVLSACQTALGNPEAELGFGGLAIKAGVRSAVASLWEVSDVGTMALMTEFYQNLRNPDVRTKAEALRQAQIALIRGEVRIEANQLRGGTRSPYTVELTPSFTAPVNNSLTHPYYWSAFTMIGSPW